MLGIELQQTQVYQDAMAEEAITLILRLLNRRLGEISSEVEAQVKVLPLMKLEELHDVASDFGQMSDLIGWLDVNHE
jgi:predicted transposase YdaD